MTKLRAVLAALFCTAVWAFTFGAAYKLLLPDAKSLQTIPYLSPLELTAGSLLIAYICLWAACPHFELPKNGKSELQQMIGGFCMGTGLFLVYASMLYISSLSAGVICMALPLALPNLVVIFKRHQKMTPGILFGTMLVVGGLVCAVLQGEFTLSSIPTGGLLALGGSICLGISLTLLHFNETENGKSMSLRKIFFYALLTLLIAAIIHKAPMGQSMGYKHLSEWTLLLPLLYIAIPVMVAMPIFWFAITKEADSQLPYYIIALIPAVCIAIGFGLMHEHLTKYTLVGAFWIIAGVMLSRR